MVEATSEPQVQLYTTHSYDNTLIHDHVLVLVESGKVCGYAEPGHTGLHGARWCCACWSMVRDGLWKHGGKNGNKLDQSTRPKWFANHDYACLRVCVCVVT